MDTQITVTPLQILVGFVALCGGFATIAGALAWAVKCYKALRAPEENQNQKIKELEDEIRRHRDFLANDKLRLDAMEDGFRASMRAQLALLSHSIDGNEVEALKESKKELQDFLIKR